MELDPILQIKVEAAPTYWIAYDAGKQHAIEQGLNKTEQNHLMQVVRETFLTKKA